MQTVQETNTDERLLKIAAEIDEFEGYTHPHAARIAALADALAKKFNLSPHDRYSLHQAALVHDIGELVMSRDYIKADRALRDEERLDMQRHTVIGEQEAAKRGFSRAVQLLVRWHHEWWNGAGYPDALGRDLIPLAARILRVCDTYAAMTDSRPHRTAISETDARKYLTEWAGLEFDPLVVKAFLDLEGFRELAAFNVPEQNQAPKLLNPEMPQATISAPQEDFSDRSNIENAEQQQQQNSPYSQPWEDNNWNKQ